VLLLLLCPLGSFGSLLFSPPISDEIPSDCQAQIQPFDQVFEAAGRASMALSFLSSDSSSSRRVLTLCSIPLLYHFVFWAPLWEYPLLLFVLAPMALTLMQVLQKRAFDPKKHLISRSDYVSPLTLQSSSSRRLLAGLAQAIGALLPFAEKVSSGLTFAVFDLSLLFVAAAGFSDPVSVFVSLTMTVLTGLVVSILVMLFDDCVVVFGVGLAALLPVVLLEVVEMCLGRELHVYELSFLRGRDLDAFDVGGTSDPYCTVAQSDIAGNKIKSSVAKKTLNPEWGGEANSFRIALGSQFRVC
jgi:hypothetical protein